MSKPTLFFVPGIWHVPECFDAVRAPLEEKGYPTAAVKNPSAGAAVANVGLEEDSKNLRAVLEPLLDEGREIVLALHSYGGMVGSSAIEGLGYAERAKAGKQGGVIMLVYITALMGTKGVSMMDLIGGAPLPSTEIGEDNYVRPVQPEYYLYQDVPEPEQSKWISKLLPNSATIYQHPCTHEPWRYLPSLYLICSEDRALDNAAQNMVIDASRKEGADITVFECEGSHSPFLSVPGKVVEALELAAKVGQEKKAQAA